MSDPTPLVLVRGFGRMTLAQVRTETLLRLDEINDKAADNDFRYALAALENGVLLAMLQTLTSE